MCPLSCYSFLNCVICDLTYRRYVDDLVDGLHKLMNGNYDQPVNLGNPEEYSVRHFAELVRHLVGSNSTVHLLPATTDDPRQRKPDITVARDHLGWAPQWPVHDGLRKTVDYFASELREAGEIVPTGPDAAKPRPVVQESDDPGADHVRAPEHRHRHRRLSEKGGGSTAGPAATVAAAAAAAAAATAEPAIAVALDAGPDLHPTDHPEWPLAHSELARKLGYAQLGRAY